jgi:hypothetical protein
MQLHTALEGRENALTHWSAPQRFKLKYPEYKTGIFTATFYEERRAKEMDEA